MAGRGSNWGLLPEISQLLLARQMQIQPINPAADEDESATNQNNTNTQQQALPGVRANNQKFHTRRNIASKVRTENAEREQSYEAAGNHGYRSNYSKQDARKSQLRQFATGARIHSGNASSRLVA